MARITVEDCLKKADNRFSLVHLAARRVRQLKKGDPPRIQCKNREIVTALREIAAGVITIETLKEIDEHLSRRYEPPVLAPPVESESEPAQPAEETAVSPESAPAEKPAEEKTEDAAEEPVEAVEHESAESTKPEESTESEEGAEPEEEGAETDAERL